MPGGKSPFWIGWCPRLIPSDHCAGVPNAAGSWINLSPFATDELGVPRAYAQIKPGSADLGAWQATDRAALDLVQAIAGSPGTIEYLSDGGWNAAPFSAGPAPPGLRRGFGGAYREAGTLWMGEDPASSVPDPLGRFPRLGKCFACDQSLIPTVGSVHPALTRPTLARGIAERRFSWAQGAAIPGPERPVRFRSRCRGAAQAMAIAGSRQRHHASDLTISTETPSSCGLVLFFKVYS